MRRRALQLPDMLAQFADTAVQAACERAVGIGAAPARAIRKAVRTEPEIVELDPGACSRRRILSASL
jgi:hypothetical protein